MTANRYRYFRWTPRTAWITFNYVIVVPSIFGVMAYSTDVGHPVALHPALGLLSLKDSEK